ncbi:hypothetical protein [Pseudobacillus badius]|nr:hypothetical protein [Bacillus badius]
MNLEEMRLCRKISKMKSITDSAPYAVEAPCTVQALIENCKDAV